MNSFLLNVKITADAFNNNFKTILTHLVWLILAFILPENISYLQRCAEVDRAKKRLKSSKCAFVNVIASYINKGPYDIFILLLTHIFNLYLSILFKQIALFPYAY